MYAGPPGSPQDTAELAPLRTQTQTRFPAKVLLKHKQAPTQEPNWGLIPQNQGPHRSSILLFPEARGSWFSACGGGVPCDRVTSRLRTWGHGFEKEGRM